MQNRKVDCIVLQLREVFTSWWGLVSIHDDLIPFEALQAHHAQAHTYCDNGMKLNEKKKEGRCKVV